MHGGNLALAFLLHRSDVETPEGWTLLHKTSGIHEGTEAYIQHVSVYYKMVEDAAVNVTFSQTDANRMYLNLLSFIGAGTPYLAIDDYQTNESVVEVSKNTNDLAVWMLCRLLWVNNGSIWNVSAITADHVVQKAENNNARLLSIVDDTDGRTLSATPSSPTAETSEVLLVGIPANDL